MLALLRRTIDVLLKGANRFLAVSWILSLLLLGTGCVLVPVSPSSNFETRPSSGVERSPAALLTCERLLEANGPRVILPNRAVAGSRVSQIRIANYNVLNLAIQVGRFVRDSRGQLRPVADPNAAGPRFKSDWALVEIRRQINEENPDLLVLQEVESRAALEIFRDALQSRYEIIHVPGNDTRGIDVAVLVRAGLAFEVRAQSHRAHQHQYFGESSLLYSRDLLTLTFHEHGRAEPLFVVAATHNKSQRSTTSDEGSAIKRSAQVEGALRILEEGRYPLARIYMGDLNADIRTAPEFRPLRGAGYRDGMEILGVADSERVTHHYFPRDDAAVSSQLDAIFFSSTWSEANAIRRSRVVPHRDQFGHRLGRPRNREERQRQASDHNMYWVDVNLEALRRHLDRSPETQLHPPTPP